MYDTVECPHCGYDNDMSDGLTDLPSNNRFDHECTNCEEEFEVQVEFTPEYVGVEIDYNTCGVCESRVRNPKYKGKVYPYPKTFIEVLCDDCWHSLLITGMNRKGE